MLEPLQVKKQQYFIASFIYKKVFAFQMITLDTKTPEGMYKNIYSNS